MQEKKYFEANGLSSSMVKDFEWQTPKSWRETYLDKIGDKEGKLHFNRGSLLDSLMLNPDSVETDFFVGDFNLPISETIQKIIVNVHKKLVLIYKEQTCLIDLSNLEDATTNEVVLECAGYENYGKGSYKEERIIREIKCPAGVEYFQYLCEADGKIIISLEDQLNAIAKKDSLLSSGLSSPFFIQQEGEILLHHLQIFLNDDGLDRKCEIDIARIVPSEKIVYITDLKTTHSSIAFMDNVRKYSYATQLGYYQDMFIKGMYSKLQNKPVEFNQEFEIPDDILQYKFILQNVVIDDKDKIPYIYRYRDIDIEYYQFGSEKVQPFVKNPVRYRRGWENTMKVIKWHIVNQLWDYPMSHYLHNYLTINLLEGYVE